MPDQPPGSEKDAMGNPASPRQSPVPAAGEVDDYTASDLEPTKPATEARGSAAALVATGIFLSRIMGLIRERAISHFFGIGPHADVFRVALKTPNFLQNLLGEGTISAAFIPIYSRMLAENRPEAAGRFAGAVFALLVVVVTILVGLGVLFARPLLTILVAGWVGDAEAVAAGTLPINRFELAVATVKITFPMAGILVLFAWGLGVLNSHRRFFLPYVAPVVWNVAIIGALIGLGIAIAPNGLAEQIPEATLDRFLFAGLWGALLGGVLQFSVLIPGVWKELKGFRLSLSRRVEGVTESIRAFGPVVLGRGAYQLSGYVDTFLAAFLAAGAIAAQNTALQLYILPISLFGMSVAASELPELSRISSDRLHQFLERINRSLRQILYLVTPTTVGYLVFGLLIVGAFFQTGRFGAADTWLVYLVLSAYSLGLLATTMTRLLQNAFYALGDTKTPAKIAVWRLVISGVVGSGLMLVLDHVTLSSVVQLGDASDLLRLGAVGLALGSSVSAWFELFLLSHALRKHDPGFTPPWRRLGQMVGLALTVALSVFGLFWVLPDLPFHVILQALLVVGAFAILYLVVGRRLGFEEGEVWIRRFVRR